MQQLMMLTSSEMEEAGPYQYLDIEAIVRPSLPHSPPFVGAASTYRHLHHKLFSVGGYECVVMDKAKNMKYMEGDEEKEILFNATWVDK